MRSLPLVAAGLLGLASLAVAGEDAPKPPAAPAPASPDRDPAGREDALKELGRRLFFDPAASRVGMRACSDCHDPAHGFSDPEKRSGDDVGPTRRHAQTIIGAGGLRAGHWDGEFERVEDVVRSRLSVEISRGGARYPTQSARTESDARKAKDAGLLAAEATPLVPDAAPAGGGERDLAPVALPAAPPPLAECEPARAFVEASAAASIPDAAHRLEASGRYAEAFEAAFGSKDVTLDRLACALQRYCAGVVSGESAYDRFEAGDQAAISDAVQRGSNLFCEQCAICHPFGGTRSTFTDGRFHNTGVAWRGHAADDRAGEGDLGAGRITHRSHDFRAFKTPTLRDVARRGPYMHDGSLPTLEAVVRRYAEGPPADPRIDPAFPKFDASGTNVADLVAFLESLTGDRRPGLAPTAWSRRASETRLSFLDADEKPLAGLAVTLVPAGDVLPGYSAPEAEPRRLTTGRDGSLVFAPPHATHVRVVLAGGLYPSDGALVPDTCREGRVRVPVRGTATLRVRFAKDAKAPESLVARLHGATCFPNGRGPVSVFARRAAPLPGTEGGDAPAGEVVYEAPFRTDVGTAADVLIPGASPTPKVTLDPTTPTVVTVP